MNANIAYKGLTTYVLNDRYELHIALRKKHAKSFRHTTINLKRVSDRWLDVFDDLTRCRMLLYVHHHKWGVVICRTHSMEVR